MDTTRTPTRGPDEPDGQHYNLHKEVGDSLKVFYDDLINMGVASRVCIVTWSEFSRRIPQNDNGTDHGSQGPMFVVGGSVVGGVYGKHPDIFNLDGDENTPYKQGPGVDGASIDRLPRCLRHRSQALREHDAGQHPGERAPSRRWRSRQVLDVRQLRSGLPAVDWYFSDPRLVLVSVEHLTERGSSRAFAARAGWSGATRALFDAGFARYWSRAAALARRATGWPPPRRRHIALVREPFAVRPYAALLNTSCWLLYAADVEPATSDPEFLAALLAHGDWMASTGEVAHAAVRGAAWWLERTDAECAAFAAAARRSTRPDAAAWRAVAEALPWMRRLRHDTLRPPVVASPHRPVPGTGLLVPAALEDEPLRLVERWVSVAREALDAYHATWRGADPARLDALCAWLATAAPPLLVTTAGGRVVWDPDVPARLDALRDELAGADAVAVAAIHDDLAVVERHTRAFLAAVVDAAELPAPQSNTLQTGYTYLHAVRRLVAYNLREPGMDRLHGPPLPFAREMVGARTVHEWAHLADAAGWVPRTVAREAYHALRRGLGEELDAAIAAAPAVVRRATASDLAALGRERSPGSELARLTTTRMPDYRANLVARAFLDGGERETYVRHNVRTLRGEYPASLLWRMLIRYLFEYQYLLPALGFTGAADPRSFFLHSTWFADDFLATGVVDERRFDALTAAVARLCACHAVDGARLRLPPRRA